MACVSKEPWEACEDKAGCMLTCMDSTLDVEEWDDRHERCAGACSIGIEAACVASGRCQHQGNIWACCSRKLHWDSELGKKCMVCY